MIVLPSFLQTSYPLFKQFLLLEKNGAIIQSQFVLDKTLMKGTSVYHNLLLQIIAKRGNIFRAPMYSSTLNSIGSETCLIGFDSAFKDGRTVISGCGTMNSSFTLTSSHSIVLDKSEHKYQHMISIATKCIERYCSRNNKVPEYVVILMKTVPTDQLNLIQESFASNLIQLLEKKYKSKFSLTVVMANLRSSESFFTESGNSVSNVPPGTLVSSNIVSPNYDFFITSKGSNMSSIVSNHYRVIFRSESSKLEEE